MADAYNKTLTKLQIDWRRSGGLRWNSNQTGRVPSSRANPFLHKSNLGLYEDKQCTPAGKGISTNETTEIKWSKARIDKFDKGLETNGRSYSSLYSLCLAFHVSMSSLTMDWSFLLFSTCIYLFGDLNLDIKGQNHNRQWNMRGSAFINHDQHQL